MKLDDLWYSRGDVTVPPGAEKEILRVQLGRRFYLRGIGHSFYDTQADFRLVYDDKEWMKWNFQLGGLSPRERYDFPIIVAIEKYVSLVVKNKSSDTRRYEGILDGTLAIDCVDVVKLENRIGTVEKLLESECK